MTASPMHNTEAIVRILYRHHHFSTAHGSGALIACQGRRHATKPRTALANVGSQTRHLASIRDDSSPLSEVWFTSSAPQMSMGPIDFGGTGVGNLEDGGKPPDERTLKLGKTIRTLHARLPTLLASPLPADILSPHISLHLFPSTHPHLPTVSGRIAYNAALWTAPVAWGRVPVVGNVKLVILSERMLKGWGGAGRPVGTHVGSSTTTHGGDERLIVRWKTCSASSGAAGLRIPAALETLKGYAFSESGAASKKDGEAAEFAGLFIFSFDEEGRIAEHTIEHAQQGGDWEKMTRVVNVTDWLLGRARAGRRRGEEQPELALGFCEEGGRRRFQGRRRGDG